MQIVKQTATTLKLQDDNPQSRRHELTGGLPFFLFFGLLSLLGGLAAILQSEQAKLTCNRSAPTQISCQLTASSLLQPDPKPQIIKQLQAAELAGSDSYQVMLVTPDETIPLTQTFTSGIRGKQQRVDKINSFLADPTQKSLTIQQNDGWVVYPTGGMFMLVGGGFLTMIFTSELQISCTFDKVTNQVRLEKQSLLAKTVQKLSFSDIKVAEVSTMTDGEGHTSPHAVQLVLSSGKKIRLQLSVPTEKLHVIAQSINQIVSQDLRS